MRRLTLTVAYYSCLLSMTALVILGAPFAYGILRYALRKTDADSIREISWQYGRGWTKLTSFFVPVEHRGFSKSLPSPCIIVPNHQSFFDAYCLGFWPHSRFVYVVQAWPFRIPLYGMAMRTSEYINIDETSGDAVIEKAAALLAKGISVVVFAEGTRSKTQKIGRFRSGAFKLAAQTGVPIVPLSIKGTGDFLPRNSYVLSSARIRVTALEPLYPSQVNCSDSERLETVLRNKTKQQLEEALTVEY